MSTVRWMVGPRASLSNVSAGALANTFPCTVFDTRDIFVSFGFYQLTCPWCLCCLFSICPNSLKRNFIALPCYPLSCYPSPHALLLIAPLSCFATHPCYATRPSYKSNFISANKNVLPTGIFLTAIKTIWLERP